MKVIYGDGKVLTGRGCWNGHPCLTIERSNTAHPIGSIPIAWDKECAEDEVDVLLVFKNVESARTLQDELNELIAGWTRDTAPRVER